jgi:hypothetical protein
VRGELRLRGRRLAVSDAAVGDAGTTFLFVRASAAARRRLAGARSVVLRIRVNDASGNRRTVDRRMRVRR